MAYNKVIYGNTTIIDLTDSTVTADTLSKGVIARNAKGERITGTLEKPTVTDDGNGNVTISGFSATVTS